MASLIMFQYPAVLGFKFRVDYIHVNSKLMMYGEQERFFQKKSLFSREKPIFPHYPFQAFEPIFVPVSPDSPKHLERI